LLEADDGGELAEEGAGGSGEGFPSCSDRFQYDTGGDKTNPFSS